MWWRISHKFHRRFVDWDAQGNGKARKATREFFLLFLFYKSIFSRFHQTRTLNHSTTEIIFNYWMSLVVFHFDFRLLLLAAYSLWYNPTRLIEWQQTAMSVHWESTVVVSKSHERFRPEHCLTNDQFADFFVSAKAPWNRFPFYRVGFDSLSKIMRRSQKK